MTDIFQKRILMVDKAIYFFAILFLCTVTNTIFLNQFGYFIPLLLILYRYYLTKENPFQKTGLEYALLFYIVVEIISTLLSLDKLDSLDNLRKRFLLIPTMYVFLFAAHDLKRTKQFVMIYLGAAITTMIVYIGLAYKYYINSFYQIYESGPGTFQYPITSSELMSFSLVLLFAFLIHEKLPAKKRILILLGFLINLVALLATYKRTGWMGAAAGILFVIILSKRWLILSPVVVGIIILALVEKNVSNVLIYSHSQNSVTKISEFKTEGRATDIYPEGNNFYLSDYDNGLIKYEGTKIIDKSVTESPVTSFTHWKNNFYIANLLDTRFVQFQLDNNNKLQKGPEFLSSGFTVDWKVANGFLYVLDSDSGLTIFRNPVNPKDKIKFPTPCDIEYQKLFVDSNYVLLYSKSNQLSVYSLDKSIPNQLSLTRIFPDGSNLIYYSSGKVLMEESNCIKLYSLDKNVLRLLSVNRNLNSIYSIKESKDNLTAVTTKGILYDLEGISSGQIISKQILNLGFVPKSFETGDGKLFFTQVKRSRLFSSFDPYNASNITRLALWNAGWKMFLDHPLFGVGDIDLAWLYKQYKHDYDKEIQGHMHNNFVHILVTLGILGFAAVLFLFYRIFGIHVKNYLLLKNEIFSGSFALGAAGIFVSFIIAGLTEWNFGDHEIITVVWFTLGFSIALVNFCNKKYESV